MTNQKKQTVKEQEVHNSLQIEMEMQPSLQVVPVPTAQKMIMEVLLQGLNMINLKSKLKIR
jgi:uncharacterized protein YjfI (DUF2170 family)